MATTLKSNTHLLSFEKNRSFNVFKIGAEKPVFRCNYAGNHEWNYSHQVTPHKVEEGKLGGRRVAGLLRLYGFGQRDIDFLLRNARKVKAPFRHLTGTYEVPVA